MYQSIFQKLLALFISGSILITSVPVYAGETTSFTEPVISEVFGETADGPDAGSAASDDSNIHDSDIFGNDDEEAWPKRLSFAHQFHEDANDPAYDALRKELDEIFRNAQLQDITELPENYSLVSLPVGGEGAGGSADRSAPIGADQGKDVLMPVYNQGDTMQTCWSFTGTGIIESYLIRNHYDKLRGQGIELSKWQVPAAASMSVSSDTVIGGYSADPSQYGEGIGYTLGDGGSPTTYGQAVTSWAGLDYEKNASTPRHKNDIYELAPAQIDQAVARGRDALFLPSPYAQHGRTRRIQEDKLPQRSFAIKVIKHDKIQTVLTTTDHTDCF